MDQNQKMTVGSTGSWREQWRSVLTAITWVQSQEEKNALLKQLVEPLESVKTLGFVNAHAMNIAAENRQFALDLASCDWLLRDGSGMKILTGKLNVSAGLNMNGTDLIPEIISAYRDKTVALWGTKSPNLETAATNLASRYGVNVVSVLDGFAPAQHYLDEFSRSKPELVILAMGMPKQESLAAMLRQSGIENGCLVVCGGAILDFLSGAITRAPRVYRILGLEWLYRLFHEPNRLFRRYVIGNPLFMWRMWML